MRVLILGDGAWAADSLVTLREAGHQLAAVLLRARPSDTSLEEVAAALGVPVLQPADVNAPACLDTLRELKPDVLLSIAYNQILGDQARAAAPWCLNVHAGKLPHYRGRNVINWALINGEREIGLTVHLIDAGIDTGDIVLQRTLPIGWTDTYGDVLDRVVRQVPQLVVDSLDLIASGQANPQPQPACGTYFGGRHEGDEWLDWARPSVEIYNKIRGISRPGPGARSWFRQEPVIIWRATYDLQWPRYLGTPGEVVGRVPDEGVVVKTGDSTILVREVQLVDRPVEVPRWSIGTRLGVDAGAVLHEFLTRRAPRH